MRNPTGVCVSLHGTLDEAISTENAPARSFDRVEGLAYGQIVEIVTEMLPIGLIFCPGEQLRLVISSRNDLGPVMPTVLPYVP